jgi:hypothetical protein
VCCIILHALFHTAISQVFSIKHRYQKSVPASIFLDIMMVSVSTVFVLRILLLSTMCTVCAYSFMRRGWTTVKTSNSPLYMGLFDGLFGSSSNGNNNKPSSKSKLDEEWEKQQELLRIRRDPEKLDKYFKDVDKRRAEFLSKESNQKIGNIQAEELQGKINDIAVPKPSLGVSGDEVYVDEGADVMGKIFGKKR